MNAENLYYLIHSLTPAQKANFSNYLSAGKGRSSKFKLLYDRMVSARSYNEEKIRGKEFASSAKYYQNRELLLNKIIQSMVFFSEQSLSTRSYVYQAMEIGAVDHARRRLVSEIGLAEKEEDTDLLSYLYALKARVEQAYRIELGDDLPQSVFSLGEEAMALAKLRALFRRTDQVLKEGKGKGGDIAPASLEAELEEIHCDNQEGYYLRLKIRSGIHLLRGDYPAAYRCQLDAVQVLEKNPFPLAQQMLPREYYLLTNFAMRFDQIETAERAVKKFALLNINSSLVIGSKHQEMWTKAAIRVAFSRANPELMRQALPSFENLARTSKPEIYLLNLLLAATTFFIHSDYTRSLELVERMRKFPKIQWPEIYWAMETLRLMIHSEMGTLELCETAYRAAMHQARQTGAQYPGLVSRTAMKMIDSEDRAGKEILLKQFTSEMETLQKDKKEEPTIDLMDFSFWFRSTAGSISKIDAFLFRDNSNQASESILGS